MRCSYIVTQNAANHSYMNYKIVIVVLWRHATILYAVWTWPILFVHRLITSWRLGSIIYTWKEFWTNRIYTQNACEQGDFTLHSFGVFLSQTNVRNHHQASSGSIRNLVDHGGFWLFTAVFYLCTICNEFIYFVSTVFSRYMIIMYNRPVGAIHYSVQTSL